jgi:hypothetical protein
LILPQDNPTSAASESGPPAGSTSFASRLIAAAAENLGLADARRVAALPLERGLTPAEVEEVSRQEIAPAFFAGTHPFCERDREGRPIPLRLWRQQADALVQFDASGAGAFVSTKVGSGKTAIAFLCLRRGHRVRGYRRSLLLIPARGVRKLVGSDLAKMERWFGFDVPVHVLAGLPPAKRLGLARSGLAGVYVSTYSLVQRPQADAELLAISPEMVVADEAHHLLVTTHNSATRRRFEALMRATRAAFVALSGTMSKKTLLNCWHLIVLCLRQGSPVPLDKIGAERWAQVIDAASGGPPPPLESLEILEPVRQRVLGWVREGRIDPLLVGGPLTPDAEGMRRAFRVRRNLAPGVVASSEDSLGATLAIQNRPCWGQALEAPSAGEGSDEANQALLDRRVDLLEARLEQETPIPTPEDWCPSRAFAHLSPFDQVIALLWAVRSRQRTPNGDEIEHGFHIWKPQFEIAAGIYNERVWPEPADLARDRGIEEDEAEKLIDRAREHRLAIRRYVREVREFLEGEHVPGIDTHLLVSLECSRGGGAVPKALYDRWLGVHAADFEGRPEQLSMVKRVCDWKIRAAVEWAKDVEARRGPLVGGLVWCWNVELAEWTHEVFESEFPGRTIYCPGGPAGDRRISDPEARPFFAVASIAAHFEIKDLWHWDEQVFVQFPRPASTAEQVLGRTHRSGQRSDEVSARTLNTLPFDHQLYSAMLHDSIWLNQAESRQKVISADYDPMPRVFPGRFLAERGFALESSGQDDALRMVFGG